MRRRCFNVYAQNGPPFGLGKKRFGGSGGPPPGMMKKRQQTGVVSATVRTDVHYDGPIFDAHSHIKRQDMQGSEDGQELLDIVGKLHEAGISGVFLFGRNRGVQMQKSKHPTTVFPFAETAVQGGKLVLNEDTVTNLEQQLQSGNFYGVGELPLRHEPTQSNLRADDPIMLKIYDLGAKYQVPVNIHFTYHADHVGELEKALAHNPAAIIIWAHVGASSASVTKGLMAQYPNLYADISTRDPYLIPHLNLTLIDTQGNLKPEWQDLFETYPERFLLGLDIWGADRANKITTLMTYFRSVLGQLSVEVAEKIAYKNAETLIAKKGGTVALTAVSTSTASTTMATSVGKNIYTDVPAFIDPTKWYLFYLHGKAVENGGRNAVTPGHGAYKYDDILQALAAQGFVVISEVRSPDTTMEYGKKVVEQINRLLNAGVPANQITVAGHSKGGALTIATSSFLQNSEIKFVIMAGCGKGTQEKGFIHKLDRFAAGMKGQVLSLYDSVDQEAGTCNALFEQATNLASKKETALNTGLGHGLFYTPHSEWIEPLASWAKGLP